MIRYTWGEGVSYLQNAKSMKYWYSCQMDQKTILQVKNYGKDCRTLQVKGGSHELAEQVMPDYPGEYRS